MSRNTATNCYDFIAGDFEPIFSVDGLGETTKSAANQVLSIT
jgi:hypothetical protein